MSNEQIWIITEHRAGHVAPVTAQLITKARKIASGKTVVAVVLETPDAKIADQLHQYGPDAIITVRDSAFKNASDRVYAAALAQLAKAKNPNTVLFGATPTGRSIAPRMQALLGTGLTADCLDLYYDADLLVAVKPSYGDNVMCEITCPEHRPQMASVRPNTFTTEIITDYVAPVTEFTVTVTPDTESVVQSVRPTVGAATGISGAKKIIALGRGVNNDATINTARTLATKLGASIGVSRPLTDRPDFSVAEQIGQSGNTVAPDFLLNLGISGAMQYLVGIDQSELIVSVNKDSAAPIMQQSDYTYTGDAQAFLAALLD